jgi:hypothetical protein
MNPMRIPCAVFRSLPGALAAVSLGVTGCLIQGNYSAKVTTADGVQIDVPLSREPVVVDDGTVSVKKFLFQPLPMDKGKGLALAFMLEFKQGAKPVAIQVDDISDTPILSVHTDNAPALSNKNMWSAGTPPRGSADDLVKWIMTLENTVKAYRFTVRLADGTTHVLRYPIFAPAPMKAYMRAQLGV